MGVTSYEPTPVLYAVVKILSDHGLKKTAKKLRKELNCDKLKDEFVPPEIKEADFNKVIKSIYKKAHKKKKLEASNSNEDDKNSNSSTKSSIINDDTVTQQSGVPFTRVKSEEWLNRIEKEELRVNSLKTRSDNFVSKAAHDLTHVKGKMFKTEKAKKKRSSWKGTGQITSAINSVSFDDSDSE